MKQYRLVEDDFSRWGEKLRAEFDAMVAPYFVDNVVRQDYLHTRATAR